MATTTTSTEPELIAEYWNNRFINELRNNLVFAPWGLKGTHPKGSGTMVHWLALADLSASSAAGTEGTDPTEHTLSAGDQTATVSQYNDVVKVSDILQETWLPGSMGTLMERIARVAAKKIDTVVRDAAFTAGGTVQYAGSAVARNSIATNGSFDMDLAEVREASRTLEGYAAQPFSDGYYRGIVHPDVKYDLQSDTANWQEILKYTETGFKDVQGFGNAASNGNGKGVVGRLFGVEFIMTGQSLKMVGSGSAYDSNSAGTDIYQSYIFGPEHFGISQLQDVQTIIKNPSPSSSLNLYGTMGYKMAFATKQLDAKRMIRIESGATGGN